MSERKAIATPKPRTAAQQPRAAEAAPPVPLSLHPNERQAPDIEHLADGMVFVYVYPANGGRFGIRVDPTGKTEAQILAEGRAKL